jgi:uncharacterized protein with ParB-like and HNH nuclease domain
MDVGKMPISAFLQGQTKSFVIPVFQRDYAWKISNCDKLWNDLIELKLKMRQDHFLGTIVTIGLNYDEYSVIDGQQRLTTISLLLLALYTFLKNKNNKNNEEETLEQQLLDFLINKYSKESDKRIRLKPNKQDRLFFEKLFDSNENIDNTSNIVNNYNFFYNKISSNQLVPIEIFELFHKLKIVLINLDSKSDDPQLIFESLNSTGVGLTAGDLIRNYILMDLEPQLQESYYKNYWIEIEKLSGDIPEFIRNYLIYKLQTWVKKDDVYDIFKKIAKDEFKNNKKDILEDLKYNAKIYSNFVQIQVNNDVEINNCLLRLNKIEFTVCHPYLFDLFNDYFIGIIKKENLCNILKLIESYAFRKILVDNTTQGLNKLFVTLSKEIKKNESWKQNYYEILKYILLEKRVSQRFPTDEEFETALINKEIYKLQSKNRNFLLESLENYNSAYSINLDNLTIEHIMPQKLTKDWKTSLGQNWQDIHNKYLHTLGNLSLTGNNSKLSNNNFDDKQKIDFQNSKLKLNYILNDVKDWNEEKIIHRAKDLIKDALKIWFYPSTNYSKQEPDEIIFDLTSEDNFTNSKPIYLYLGEDEKGISVSSWRDVLRNVCSFLYDYSPTQFNEIMNSKEFEWYFNRNKPLITEMEFKENLFVESTMSANSIYSFLVRICNKIGFDPEQIQFSIK